MTAQCRGIAVGALKMREWKMLEWKMREYVAGMENAGAIMHGKLSEEKTIRY